MTIPESMALAGLEWLNNDGSPAIGYATDGKVMNQRLVLVK